MAPRKLALLVALGALGSGAALRATVTFTVNAAGDAPDAALDGVCETAPGSGLCTLRAAVFEADHSGDPSRLVQVPAITVQLNLGPLSVTSSLTIQGVSLASSIVQAAAGVDQQFLVQTGGVLTLRDLQIDHFHPPADDGGAIKTWATLVAERCEFYDDTSALAGGAIAVESSASLFLDRTAFAADSAQYGGCVWSLGTISVDNSIFEGCTATGGAGVGGAILTGGAHLQRIERSFFAGNTSGGKAGAVSAGSSGETLDIVDSTFDGNSAVDSGGAVYVFPGTAVVRVYNSTFSANRADSDADGGGSGGAIYSSTAGSSISNSILAGNHETVFFSPQVGFVEYAQECAGVLSSNGHDIVQANDGSCAISGGATSADPLLQPPVYNGGFTRTRAIRPGSPAIDAGEPGGCNDAAGPLPTDQRGAARSSGAACDLGAFEYGSLIFDDGFDFWGTAVWSAHSP
jgi:hypothetical protein